MTHSLMEYLLGGTENATTMASFLGLEVTHVATLATALREARPNHGFAR